MNGNLMPIPKNFMNVPQDNANPDDTINPIDGSTQALNPFGIPSPKLAVGGIGNGSQGLNPIGGLSDISSGLAINPKFSPKNSPIGKVSLIASEKQVQGVSGSKISMIEILPGVSPDESVFTKPFGNLSKFKSMTPGVKGVR